MTNVRQVISLWSLIQNKKKGAFAPFSIICTIFHVLFRFKRLLVGAPGRAQNHIGDCQQHQNKYRVAWDH